MATEYVIRRSEYHDSVALMETARELNRLPDVLEAAVVMGTPANQAILREAGLLVSGVEQATSNDLVVVVRATSASSAGQALQAAEQQLQERGRTAVSPHTRFQPERRPRTIRSAVRSTAAANLAIVSVAGYYAAAEAWEALRSGLHVLLFSDNVSVQDEAALKTYAAERDLLLMGPDCGTAILNGVALGFANAVPRGPVGIVSAAGTGLQEVSTLLARLGVGISQGIGTGGRDLARQVGGITMQQGIKALQSDPQTEVLLLVSKPPAPEIAEKVLAQLGERSKPAVVCFLGRDLAAVASAGAIPARTLQEAAYLAAAQVSKLTEEALVGRASVADIEREAADLHTQALDLRACLSPGQRYLRGLFSGGTLATEALVIWQSIVAGGVLSNVPLDPHLKLADAAHSELHCAVDLGEDAFTVGRLHPMLDNEMRIRRLLQEADDPQVAVIVLDVVLGYGAHPDPAAELGSAIRKARTLAAAKGRNLLITASVTGTEQDPQGRSRQVQGLQDAGAIVASCNAAAARLAGYVVASKEER